MKRLGIFVFYDKDGIVDRYVEYLLDQMKLVLNRIVIVSNVHLERQEQEKLCAYTKEYFERENIGFDAGAYKDVLCNFIGWEEIGKYDELVMFNDTFYGFFCSAEQIFKSMSKKDCDFWGITVHYANLQDFIAEHVQSYFLVIRSRMLHDPLFMGWWRDLKYPVNSASAVSDFEIAFSVFFSNLGYHHSSYVDTSEWKHETENNGFNFTGYRIFRLLSELSCPILKKKNIALYPLDSSDDALKTLQYIESQTDYDANLIWENLLRLYDISILQKNFHFTLCIPEVPSFPRPSCSTALLLILDNIRNLPLLARYLINVQLDTMYIFVRRKEFCGIIEDKIKVKGLSVIYLENNNISPFLLVSSNFDYYFFLTDEINTCVDPLTADRILFSRFDAFIKSKEYCNNLLACMEESSKIGLVMPNFESSEIFQNISLKENEKWNMRINAVQNLILQQGLKIPMSEGIRPFIYGKCFCAKKDAIKQLFVMSRQDETFFSDVLPYALIYIAQANGYLSYRIYRPYDEPGIVLQNNASDNIPSPFNLQRKILYYISGLLSDIEHFDDKYIYGTGFVGTGMAEILDAMGFSFSGFVVSDGEKKESLLMKHPVFYLSQIKNMNNSCFILGVSKKNRENIIKNLRDYGAVHFF